MGESGCGLPGEFCFMDLKKGSKFIGFLCMIVSLVSSILLLIYLSADIDEVTEEISADNQSMKEKLEPHNASIQTVAGLLLALCILYFISSILLINGANGGKRKQMIPFLAITVIAIISSLIIAVTQYPKGEIFAVLTISVALLYFFLCVLSLYQKLARGYSND